MTIKWPVCLLLSIPFGLVLAFQAWLSLFLPVFGLSDTLYNLTICEKDIICVQSSKCQHDLQESLQKMSDFIVWGEVVHQLDHIQQRQYLQEAKLQPKVKVVVYESEADNPAKKSLNQYSQSSTDTRNGVRTGKSRRKLLLKQKLKDRLQRTRQSARNKESRTLRLEAIRKLCRHGRIIYYSSKQNGFVIVSQRINFYSFSFQIAVHLTLFVIVF